MEEIDRNELKIQRANLMRDLYNHEGFKLLKAEIENRIADARHIWLKAKDKDAAEAIRLKTTAYQDVYDIITGKILEGAAASQIIKQRQK